MNSCLYSSDDVHLGVGQVSGYEAALKKMAIANNTLHSVSFIAAGNVLTLKQE